MEAFLGYVRRMTWIILAVGLAVAVGLWLQAKPEVWYSARLANGYWVGLLAGIAALRLVDAPATLESVTYPDPKQAAKRYYVKMLKNIAIYGLALVVVFALKRYFEPWGALLGMITSKAVLVVDSILRPSISPSTPDTSVSAPDENRND